MKRLVIIVFVPLLLFFYCSKRSETIVNQRFRIPSELLQIDSLMQQRPDSALRVLLLPVADSANKYYHSLLLSEALYKTDNPQYYRAELRSAMHHFDSIAIKYSDDDVITLLSARSHYMNGVGLYENDSIVEACNEYLCALQIMENHFDESALDGNKAMFMGLIYTRLGELFYLNDIAAYSIESYKHALAFFEKSSKKRLANTYRCLGNSYRLQYNDDSALYYYRKAMVLSEAQNNERVLGFSLAESAPAYYNMGLTDSAFFVINKALSMSTNEEQRLTRTFTLGWLLSKEGRCDSAIICFKQSMNHSDYSTRTASEELLVKCYHALGDTLNEQRFAVINNESLKQFVLRTPLRVELSSSYENYLTGKAHNQHKANLRFINKNVFVVIVVIAAIMVLYVSFSLIRHKKKNEAISLMDKKIKANTFEEEKICSGILGLVDECHFKARMDYTVYAQYALGVEQLHALRNAVDLHFGGLCHVLIENYPELTDDDINYCCLYLLGLKDADVSALMQRSYTAVSDRKRKLKRVFSIQDDLTHFLKNLVLQRHK